MELQAVYFVVLFLHFGRHVKGYEIGAPCNYDSDCFIENAFCRNQQICECKENFQPTEDRQMCIATVGAVCETKYDCSTLEHSDCRQFVCECEKMFVPDPKGFACLPQTSNIRGPCQQDIQCQASFGDKSRCENGACVCFPRHHFTSRRCYQSRGLHEICQNNSDCYIGEDYVHRVQCKFGQCRCVDGFTKSFDNKCLSSSAHSNTASSLGFLLVLLMGTASYIYKFIRGVSIWV